MPAPRRFPKPWTVLENPESFVIQARRIATGRRWALGERPIPDCVAILFRLLLAKKITVADVEAAAQ